MRPGWSRWFPRPPSVGGHDPLPDHVEVDILAVGAVEADGVLLEGLQRLVAQAVRQLEVVQGLTREGQVPEVLGVPAVPPLVAGVVPDVDAGRADVEVRLEERIQLDRDLPVGDDQREPVRLGPEVVECRRDVEPVVDGEAWTHALHGVRPWTARAPVSPSRQSVSSSRRSRGKALFTASRSTSVGHPAELARLAQDAVDLRGHLRQREHVPPVRADHLATEELLVDSHGLLAGEEAVDARHAGTGRRARRRRRAGSSGLPRPDRRRRAPSRTGRRPRTLGTSRCRAWRRPSRSTGRSDAEAAWPPTRPTRASASAGGSSSSEAQTV